MRFKKGFTLAEILIVLMVIGALATMTIPSLMKGVQEAQFKTAYKKALNSIVNLTTMEKLSGNLPSVGNTAGMQQMFDILNGRLSVKAYYNEATIGQGKKVENSQYITQITTNASSRYNYWIVTEDNLAYHVTAGGATNVSNPCATKLGILEAQKNITQDTQLAQRACFVIYVDVNGLSAGPNLKLPSPGNYIAVGNKLNPITTDIFPIYVGIDGATAGNQKNTVTGRIAADVK